MKRVVFAGMMFLSFAAFAAAEDPKLTNEKLVLQRDSSYVSADEDRSWAGLWPTLLSEDGRRLFYLDYETPRIRQDEEPVRLYHAYLRDLKTGRDIPLPAPAVTDDKPLLAMMNLRIFSSSGQRIVFGIGEDTDSDGVSNYPDMSDRMRGILYDIPSGKVIDLGMSATVLMPSIDSKGRGLLVVSADMENQMMTGKLIVRLSGEKETWTFSTWGLPGAVCPTADLLPMLLPADPQGKDTPEFVLYDVRDGKKYASLPITSPFFSAGGLQTHWTRDGRYMYYPDARSEVMAMKSKSKTLTFTRIYDRVEKKQLTAISGFAVGPGPGDSIMVVAGKNKDGTYEVVLYDTATKQTWPLAKKTICPIRANGKYLLYTKTGDGRPEDVYAAEIMMPTADTAKN